MCASSGHARVRYFNPRSREGSDLYSSTAPVRLFYFNPRSREGSDDHRQHRQRTGPISIHAPVKGATCEVTGHAFLE